MNKNSFPQWFIDEIVDPNIKQRALNRDISSRETIQFKCSKGHVFSRRVDNYINLTTMEKRRECPQCKKNKRVYPQEFIDALLYKEDKKKAIEGSLSSTERVSLICDKGHITSSLVCFKVNLTTCTLNGPLCSVCSKEDYIENNREKNKKVFPKWFIDSLLYDEDRDRAIKGIISSEETLYFKCPKGHISKSKVYNKIRVSDMTQKNNICRECSKEASKEKRNNTIKNKWVFPEWFIKELVNEDDKQKALNHTLSGADEVEFCCPRGHHYRKKVNQRLRIDGTPFYGCEECFKEDQSLIATPFFEYPQWFIDELVDEEDIKLAKIGKLPVGKKVKIKCPTCGDIYIRHVRFEINVETKERARLCNKCRLKYKKENPLINRPDYPEWFIDMLANEEDKERARNKMLRVDERVQFKCPEGHLYKATVFSRLKLSTGEKRDRGCRECARSIIPIKREETLSKKRVFPEWFINELYLEEDKEKARNKTLKSDDFVQFVCPVGHVYTQRVSGHIKLSTGERRKGCHICFYQDYRSHTELEIDTYIQSLGFSTDHVRFKNPTNSYSYFEIDIYIPDKKIGIEYNGSYWHKTLPVDKFSNRSTYHQRKYLACKMLGFRMISIFEPDWMCRKDKIKQYLKDLLLPKDSKVYSRKCFIKCITSNEANEMYDKYHLLGKTTVQSISYGLFYNNDLVSCMTFQKGRYKEENTSVWCLTRFVTKSGLVVVGGASKLLKQFERDYNPSVLVSFSDNDYFSGDVYEKLGFENKGCTKSPRYFWWLEDQEIKREQCQLKKLSKKYPELYAESLNISGNKEDYIMLKLGAFKVYRSGHTKWVKKYTY